MRGAACRRERGNEQPGGWAATADRIIDATGKYVLPGGIDAHTHMEMPFGGTFASDTFETGTRAAAWGGTTTFVDFTDATAVTPGSSPSSSAASRLMSETNRNGPACSSTCAMTRSLVTLVTRWPSSFSMYSCESG